MCDFHNSYHGKACYFQKSEGMSKFPIITRIKLYKKIGSWPGGRVGGMGGIGEGRRGERVEGEPARANLHIVPCGMVIHKGKTMHVLYYCWLCCLVSLVLPFPSSAPHTYTNTHNEQTMCVLCVLGSLSRSLPSSCLSLSLSTSLSLVLSLYLSLSHTLSLYIYIY